MEVLRHGRAHARAEAGRHDDRGESRLHHEGWGARIRTWGRGTKTRCLTTWLRPTTRRKANGGPALLRRAGGLVRPVVVQQVDDHGPEYPRDHEYSHRDDPGDDSSADR